ncbi:MAG TPA: cytochrome c [Kofleriaceae bacterium]|nr:cytochrome c [Kofleriaceae bacterium]
MTDRLAAQIGTALAMAAWTTLSASLLVAALALGGPGAALAEVWPDAAAAALLLVTAGLVRGRRLAAGAALAAAALALPFALGPSFWPGQEPGPGRTALAVLRDLQLLYAAAVLVLLSYRRAVSAWHPAAAGLWLLAAALAAAFLLGGCADDDRGRRLYDRYCAVCHGESGDGRGPSAAFLWPPPRDFRSAQFKFAPAGDGALPSDEDLTRVVRQGLAGTAMQPWDLPDAELGPILDHIKSFSPPGRGFRDPQRRPAARLVIPADPYTTGASRAAALSLGALAYHGDLQCSQCHPAYGTPAQLAAWKAPRPVAPLDPVPKWSATYRSVLLPPDFLRHPMRWVRAARTRDGRLDHDAADLYRIVAQGMNGPMPGYGHLPPNQIWAVVHYTKWVADQRDTDTGRALRRKLDSAWRRATP